MKCCEMHRQDKLPPLGDLSLDNACVCARREKKIGRERSESILRLWQRARAKG